MRIFEPIDPPAHQAKLKINRHATWHTWSRDFRALFKPWSRELLTLKPPVSIHLLRGREYDDTYSIEPSGISDRKLLRDLKAFAKDLYSLEVSDQLMLFDNLIDEELSGRALHYLFSFLRAALVDSSGDPLSALCQPISRSRRTGSEFPLHSDLYVPAILFNVFDNVEPHTGGASLFLAVTALVDGLSQVSCLPAETRERIARNLTQMHDKDLYEENFELLHGCAHEWTQQLERLMKRRQFRIQLRRGQGYMIHDRKWLHGREAMNGRLSNKRLHRLIFNTRQTQRASLRTRVPG